MSSNHIREPEEIMRRKSSLYFIFSKWVFRIKFVY